MQDMVLQILQQEVARQCRFVFISVDDLRIALKNRNIDRVWYSIQTLLVAIGNISKLFWPTNGKPRIELMNSLYITDNSSLRTRVFRNHFEHFDERLEEWVRSSRQHNFIDLNLGTIHSDNPINIFRNFDPESFSVIFRGNVYEIKPVIEEVRSLYKIASAKV